MDKLIERKIEEIYSTLMNKPNQVLDIFNDFFEETKVDMQGFMDMDTFKSWIDTTPIFAYISRKSLKLIEEADKDYDIEKPLTGLEGDILTSLLNSTSLIDDIRIREFESGFILVHFPHVRITNEHNRYVDIKDLYAKIKVSSSGTLNGGFALNRANYSYLHISNNYMHSHIGNIPFRDFTEFRNPCLGSGPIKDTITNLNIKFDPDIWKLFCLELSKYVEVESISGGPYHRLENLRSSNSLAPNDFSAHNIWNHRARNYSVIRDFTTHFIKSGKLKFDYKNKSYSIGMPFTEYIITISNEFINWYNIQYNKEIYTHTFSDLKNLDILRRCIIANNQIYLFDSRFNTERYKQYIGKKVCTFKGKDVLISIDDILDDYSNESIILNIDLALFILTKILYVINYKYGKPEQTDSEGNRISEKIKYF